MGRIAVKFISIAKVGLLYRGLFCKEMDFSIWANLKRSGEVTLQALPFAFIK